MLILDELWGVSFEVKVLFSCALLCAAVIRCQLDFARDPITMDSYRDAVSQALGVYVLNIQVGRGISEHHHRIWLDSSDANECSQSKSEFPSCRAAGADRRHPRARLAERRVHQLQRAGKRVTAVGVTARRRPSPTPVSTSRPPPPSLPPTRAIRMTGCCVGGGGVRWRSSPTPVSHCPSTTTPIRATSTWLLAAHSLIDVVVVVVVVRWRSSPTSSRATRSSVSAL